jgi:hypothetical protein
LWISAIVKTGILCQSLKRELSNENDENFQSLQALAKNPESFIGKGPSTRNSGREINAIFG